MSVLTVEQFKQALPEKFKKSVNQSLIDQVNNTLSDPNEYEVYRNNLLGYASVLKDGRFKIEDYLKAVRYCSHKIMGASNIEAFRKSFPNRYQNFINNGTSDKDIASYITAYNKSKLVNLIMEQSIIPSYILNQDLYQKAINTQAELMLTANSEKVRSDAANSLLNHLRPPEVQKVELDIGIKENDAIKDLRQTILDLSLQQQQMIKAGVLSAKDVAEQRVIGQVIEHEEA